MLVGFNGGIVVLYDVYVFICMSLDIDMILVCFDEWLLKLIVKWM